MGSDGNASSREPQTPIQSPYGRALAQRLESGKDHARNKMPVNTNR
jgi:hypothetical protein